MDLTGVTHISDRSGNNWRVDLGSVRTASLQTLTGRRDFLEFVAGDERVFVALDEVAQLRATRTPVD